MKATEPWHHLHSKVWVRGLIVDTIVSDTDAMIQFLTDDDAECLYVPYSEIDGDIKAGSWVDCKAEIRHIVEDWDGFDLTVKNWNGGESYIIAGKEYVWERE